MSGFDENGLAPSNVDVKGQYNQTYFSRMREQLASQAAVEQQAYGTNQAYKPLPEDLSYKQRIAAVMDNNYNSMTDDDMIGLRRSIVREQMEMRDRMRLGLDKAFSGVPALALTGLIAPIAGYTVLEKTQGYRQRELDYKYAGSQFANQIDTYRARTGFSRDMSFDQASNMGNALRDRAYQGGSFFNVQDLTRMNAVASANGMFNVKEASGGMEGQTKEYLKQFDQLRKNTELVVKTLKTTMDGALKTIKELNQMGITGEGVQNYIGMTKAAGKMTGTGYDGFQKIGGIGAGIGQQYGYQGVVGMQQMQANYMQVNQQAYYNAGIRGAVQQVGGVANASAIITNAQMAIMNSAYGQKTMYAMMKNDGSIDSKNMHQFLSKGMSAYDISNKANERGYAIGIGGRASFRYKAMEAFQSLSADDRMRFDQQQFKTFSNSYARQGTDLDKAYAYAEQTMPGASWQES